MPADELEEPEDPREPDDPDEREEPEELQEQGSDDAVGRALAGLRRELRERLDAAESAVTERYGQPDLFELFERVRRAAGTFGMEERSAEVDEFGLSVDAVDAAKIEAANDAMERIGRSIEGVRNALAIALAPVLQEIADRFNAIVREVVVAHGGAVRVDPAHHPGARLEVVLPARAAG